MVIDFISSNNFEIVSEGTTSKKALFSIGLKMYSLSPNNRALQEESCNSLEEKS